MNADHTNYDLLYNPRLTVKGFAQIVERWQLDAQKARASLDCYLDVPYGADETEKLDIFRARGPSKGLLMFIHGGYWRALDKSDFSFVAPALANAGITVAVPNYALCPKVQVRDIVMQLVQAGAWLYRNGGNFGAPRGNLHVAGHSSGGHLGCCVVITEWEKEGLPRDILNGALLGSGMYDLKPVRLSKRSAYVTFTDAMEQALSPQRHIDKIHTPLVITYGTLETPEFQRQSREFYEAVKAAGKPVRLLAGKAYNHFETQETLGNPYGFMGRAALEMMGLGANYSG